MAELQKKTILPTIPFELPTNDILSFAGESFHYHVLGYSWSGGFPEMTLLRLQREGDVLTGTGEPESIDLTSFESVSMRFSGPVVCVGRTDDGNYIPCPGSRTPDRFPQCMVCLLKDIPDPDCIFEPHCHTDPCGAKFCQVEHVVYLTAFRDRMKVGMTQQRRMRTRALEQGADAMLPVTLVKDRFSARAMESVISSLLGLPQMLPSSIKLSNMSRPKDLFAISMMLENAKDDIVMLWERAIEAVDHRSTILIGPENYDADNLISCEIPLEEPLPSSPKRYRGERVRGKVIGYKGNYMIFRQGGLFAFRIGETPGKVVHSDMDLLSRS